MEKKTDIQNEAPYIHSFYIFKRKPEVKTYIYVWIDEKGEPVYRLVSYKLTDDINFVNHNISGKGLSRCHVVKRFKGKFLIKNSILISQDTLDFIVAEASFNVENSFEETKGKAFKLKNY